jgi:hypothetical protein
MILKIEIQEIDDVCAIGQVSPYRKAAIDVIQEGGTVYVVNIGEPVGKATTIDELNRLIGTRAIQ